MKASCTVTVKQPAAASGTQARETSSPAPTSPSTPASPATPAEPSTQAHVHTWVDVTKTIHYEDENHFERRQVGTRTVVDEEAWDEDVYEYRMFCTKCGYSSPDGWEVALHIVNVHDADASYASMPYKVDTIHHPAVTHEEPIYEDVLVIDQVEHDETVVVGQRCTGCGATK